jgi:hypothetical protein
MASRDKAIAPPLGAARARADRRAHRTARGRPCKHRGYAGLARRPPNGPDGRDDRAGIGSSCCTCGARSSRTVPTGGMTVRGELLAGGFGIEDCPNGPDGRDDRAGGAIGRRTWWTWSAPNGPDGRDDRAGTEYVIARTRHLPSTTVRKDQLGPAGAGHMDPLAADPPGAWPGHGPGPDRAGAGPPRPTPPAPDGDQTPGPVTVSGSPTEAPSVSTRRSAAHQLRLRCSVPTP